MSLRCVGNQLLQTPPSPLLGGVATASLSIWIRVNPGSVINPAGVVLFGDLGGKLTVGLSGSGGLQVAWSSNDGRADATSRYEQGLLPGVTYHVASSWKDGVQQFFVNGIPVGSDNKHGTLGKLGDSQPHPFRLGSNLAGVDVTLDEATLWVGYALTAQDVAALRDRIAHPEGVAPASIALRWSMAGADGLVARVGDAGLSDASSTGLSLSSLTGTAPVYVGGVLAFDPRTGGCTASVCPSGQAILFLFRDQATNPVPVKDLSNQAEIQSLTMAGPQTGNSFTLALDGQKTAPIAPTQNPPKVYVQWPVTLGSPGAVDLAINSPVQSYLSPATLYEIFDGPSSTSPIATVTLDLTRVPVPETRFSDSAVDVRGVAVPWSPLGRFTFATTTIRVRMSCPATNGGSAAFLYGDALRVAPVGGAVRYVGPLDGATHANTLGGSDQRPTPYDLAGHGNSWNDQGGGSGPYYTLDPAAVQSAMAALSNVGAGNVSATGNGLASNPIRISFLGSLSQQKLSLLVSSDPAVTVGRLSAGGNWPRLRINGGTPIALANPYWGTCFGDPSRPTAKTSDPYLPFVVFPFIQSAPAVRYEPTGDHLNSVSGGGGKGWDDSRLAGYSTTPQVSAGIGARATWRQEGLPAGQYRISATWPAGASMTTDAVYTVTNRAGVALGTYHVNQAAVPDGDTDQGVRWHVLGSFTLSGMVDDLILTLTNNAAGVMVADAARFERVSADTSIRIAKSDVVTCTSGVGWALTTAGPAPESVDATVANLVGSTLYPAIPATPRTMPVGWNLNVLFGYQGVLPYANLAAYAQDWGASTVDADGYPTTFQGSATDPSAFLRQQVVFPPISRAGVGQGWRNIPSGPCTVLWDGASNVSLEAVEDTSKAVITGTKGNRRVFNLQPQPGYYGPVVNVRLYSSSKGSGTTFNVDVKNLRIYPSSIADPANPPKYMPGFLEKVRAAGSIRFMDSLGAISGNNTTYADYQPAQTRMTKYDRQRSQVTPIASVAPYPFDGANPYDPALGAAMQVTTTVPHNLQDGYYVEFTVDPGPVNLLNTKPDDSPILSLKDFTSVRVLSPTSFTIQMGPRPNRDSSGKVVGSPVTMTGSVGNVGGKVRWEAGNGMPLADMVEICNLANNGKGADIFLNTGITNNDACLTGIGTYLAQNLKPGSKARIEFANEPWNFISPPFTFLNQAAYAQGKGLNWISYYCDRSAHHWSVIGQAMTAQGRGSDMVRVLGGQYGYVGLTQQMADYCKGNGYGFDEFAVAPYIDFVASFASAPAPNEPSLKPLVDLLTADQHLDLGEAMHTFTGYEKTIPQYRAALDASGFPSARVVGYEGGPSGTVLYTTGVPSRVGERSHAVHRSPRYYGFLLHHLRTMEEAGMKLYHFYFLSGGGDQVQPDGSYPMWSAYQGTDQPAGTGDPALDPANVATPDRIDLIKSEAGGAFNRWSSLVGGTNPPPNPPNPPTQPGRTVRARNGQLRARGAPRKSSRSIR
jgi:hypothetical protein